MKPFKIVVSGVYSEETGFKELADSQMDFIRYHEGDTIPVPSEHGTARWESGYVFIYSILPDGSYEEKAEVRFENDYTTHSCERKKAFQALSIDIGIGMLASVNISFPDPVKRFDEIVSVIDNTIVVDLEKIGLENGMTSATDYDKLYDDIRPTVSSDFASVTRSGNNILIDCNEFRSSEDFDVKYTEHGIIAEMISNGKESVAAENFENLCSKYGIEFRY